MSNKRVPCPLCKTGEPGCPECEGRGFVPPYPTMSEAELQDLYAAADDCAEGVMHRLFSSNRRSK